MTRVILVRHGETTSNIGGIVQGRGNLDRPELQSTLTTNGEQQATLAGKALQGIQFDAVYTSPLVRTKQTLELIAQQVQNLPGAIAHPLLCEIDLAEWEGLDFEQIRRDFPTAYHQWQNQPREFQLGDRYPIVDLFTQAQAFWQEILPRHPEQTILLIGHSGINRALLTQALGLEIDCYHRFQQYNCAITVLNLASDRAQLESVNLVTHLAPLLGSYLPPTRSHHVGPRILLVRHGETEWNRQGKFQGQIDVPLNSRGEQQAELAGNFLAYVPIDYAFSSSMARPKQTALKILERHSNFAATSAAELSAQLSLELLPQVGLWVSDRLQEISHGQWEGKLEPEIAAEFPGQLELWQSQPELVQMPAGENLDQVWHRVAEVWQEIIASIPPGKTALVVAHDAVNKAILCQVLGLTPKHFWTFKQGNGGVSVIDYAKGADQPAILQSVNITSHISAGILDRTVAGAL
ncbi:MAG: histidine phosphatase family protein [Pseudanabaenaceae cyanobacterium bins.68]|nr:histidine phosphatase family protein [Pseudanabaenaceae cyanobacterium bins.68]